MTFAQSALALATELLTAHERSGRGSVSVVPVVLDDLAGAFPALRAFIELTGAVVLDSEELVGAFPLTADPIRGAAVATPVEITAGATRRSVELTRSAAGADFVFTPSAGGPPSPGDRTLLGVARAAAHADLDAAEVAVIIYREGALDLHARRAAWHLAVARIAGMPHASLRTLVVVVEATIDPGLHCASPIGFRMALESGRMLRRHGVDDLSATVGQLVSGRGPLVLFLGAGFSFSSRLPLGNSLRDAAIVRVLGLRGTTGYASSELAERFYDWVMERERLVSPAERLLARDVYLRTLTLEQVVRAERGFHGESRTLADFKDLHDKRVASPGSAVLDLCRILGSGAGRSVILLTVNFDCLVEHASAQPLRVFAEESEFLNAESYVAAYLEGRESAIPYLKLHGTIEDLDSCIVSAEQTEAGIAGPKARVLRRLLSASGQTSWVYVGASMRDRDLLPVLNDPDFGRGLDERWVAPYLAETVEEFGQGREPYWRDSTMPTVDDRLISESADVFFAHLASAWPTRQP